MANDLNRCEFIGRLGRDPEIKYTQGDVAVANFSIACGERWKNKDGTVKENTEWVRCVAWKQLAEIIGKYVTKGSQVYVAGKMQTRQWEDKDGNNRYTTEIVVKDMQMLGSKGDKTEHHQQPQNNQPPAEDDVPF